MTDWIDPAVWTNWADAAALRLAERAQEAEALRSVPEATVREAAQAGYFHLLAPTTAGGAGASMTTFLEVGRRLARGCPSSAWTLSFLALHAWLLCRFEPELQQALFRDGAMPLAPAPLAPTGKAEAVEGGYRISGRWDWATGVNHADWVMVNAADGMMPRFCVLPIGDVEVEDVWRTAGMAATGSNTVVARDVFVPAHRTLSALQMKYGPIPGLALHPGSSVGYAMSPALALVAAAPALGAAEGALAAFTERMQAKVQAYSGVRQSEAPATHLRLGEALARVRAAALVWEDAVALYEREGALGGGMSNDSLAAIRLAAAHTVRLACEAVDGMCAAAGASSGFLTSPLQRHLRDLQMIRGHVVFDWDRAAQIGGRIALGFEPTPADLL
ncbi:MAG: acyl-CoA dehydrogenase family protein [Caulobacter sp.]|nr:acyl-CoA dehydrogenase family protein [Caulobacter sp.]